MFTSLHKLHLAALIIMVSLSTSVLFAETLASGAPRETKHSSSGVATKTDHAVLNVVLADLLKSPEMKHPSRPSGGKLVLVARQPAGFSRYARLKGESAGMGPIEMPQVEREVFDSQAARSSRARSPETEDSGEERQSEPEWSKLKPSAKQVLVRNVDLNTIRHALLDPDGQERKSFRDVRSFVVAYLPGYSKDGRTALVQIEVWQIPEIIGVFVLRENHGRWKVEQKWLGPPIL